MHNNTIFWALVGSVIAVLVIAFISVTFLVTKIIKLRNKTRKANTEANLQGIEKLMSRKDRGEIDKDLYQLTLRQLNDEQIEFSINTIIRNNYKKGLLIGENNGYEAINFIKKTNCSISLLKQNIINNDDKIQEFQLNNPLIIIDKINKEDYFDFIMIKEMDNWNQFASELFNNLNSLGLLFFFNSFEHKKEKKLLNKYLDEQNIKHEEMKFANGIILVVKKKNINLLIYNN